MITKAHIEKLFEELWHMEYNELNKKRCLDLLELLQFQFKKHKFDFDTLLENILKYDGIGITIGTGLIWAVYEDYAVPFDKWTYNHSLKNGYIKRGKTISNNYSEICSSIIENLNARKTPINIYDYVRESRSKIEGTPFEKFLIKPI
jgi:hypothetical protein